jgi:hypothetical protein
LAVLSRAASMVERTAIRMQTPESSSEAPSHSVKGKKLCPGGVVYIVAVLQDSTFSYHPNISKFLNGKLWYILILFGIFCG